MVCFSPGREISITRLQNLQYPPMHVLPLTSTVIPGGHWQKKEPGVLMHFPLIQTPGNTWHSSTSESHQRKTRAALTTASVSQVTHIRHKSEFLYGFKGDVTFTDISFDSSEAFTTDWIWDLTERTKHYQSWKFYGIIKSVDHLN